jgi:hypothetical protein
LSRQRPERPGHRRAGEHRIGEGGLYLSGPRQPRRRRCRPLCPRGERRYSDRSILLLSGNPAYRLSSLATGTRLTAAIKRRFKLGSGLVIGKHTWFVIPHSGAAAGLVQVHGATVTGVGLISAGLTGSTQRDRGLLSSFG